MIWCLSKSSIVGLFFGTIVLSLAWGVTAFFIANLYYAKKEADRMGEY